MRKFAILIGVETYDDKRISSLPYATADVIVLANRLRGVCAFDDVTVLADTGADGPPEWRAIDAAMERYAVELQPTDLLLFYFAGHGVEGRDNRRYLLTRDCPQQRPDRGLSMSHLEEWLARLEASRRVLLLDACRNDPTAGRGNADNVMSDSLARDIIAVSRATPPSSDVVTAIFSACTRGQRAFEWPAEGHGVFTHYLIKGIDGAAWSDSELEFRQLARYTVEQVARWSGKMPGCEQKPWYEEAGKPEAIVLARRALAQASTPIKPAPAANVRPSMTTPVPVVSPVTRLVSVEDARRQSTPRTQDGVCREDCGPAHTVAFSSDSTRIAAAGKSQTLCVWKVGGQGMDHRFEGHSDSIMSIGFLPGDSQKVLSAGADDTICLWGPESNKPLLILKGHHSPIHTLSAAPKQRLLAAGDADGTICVWDLANGKIVARWQQESVIFSVAFSPDGTRLLSGNKAGCIRIWNATSGKLIKNILRKEERKSAAIYSVAWSPKDDRFLSGGHDRVVRLWDMNRGKEVRVFRGHTAAVRCIAFSPDGRLIASGSGDKTVRLWDVTNG